MGRILNEMMAESRKIEKLRFAMQALEDSDIDERAIDVIREALKERLAAAEEQMFYCHTVYNAGKPWSDADDEIMKKVLRDKAPETWQAVDELFNELIVKLKRGKSPIRKRAEQLGLQRALSAWGDKT